MDFIDLTLRSIRYVPLCLMLIGVVVLIRIQLKELKKY